MRTSGEFFGEFDSYDKCIRVASREPREGRPESRSRAGPEFAPLVGMNARDLLKGATLNVVLSPVRWSHSQSPKIEIRAPKGAGFRKVTAMVHIVAAEVSLATPDRERWVVQTEVFDQTGHVELELSAGTAEETERGLALLRSIARLLG